MKFAGLFSGGKDSTYSICRTKEMGHDIVCLITMHPAADDSLLFHYPNSRLTSCLAEAMEMPLIDVETAGKNIQDETAALELAIMQAKSIHNIEGVVHGGIASVFQKKAFEEVCQKCNVKPLAPLWGVNPEKYMDELLDNNFTIMIVGVSAMGLGKEWLGRILDRTSLAQLVVLSKKHGFNLTFEGGEAETLVVDCPLFKKKLVVRDAKTHWDGQRGIFEILEMDLVSRDV